MVRYLGTAAVSRGALPTITKINIWWSVVRVVNYEHKSVVTSRYRWSSNRISSSSMQLPDERCHVTGRISGGVKWVHPPLQT